MIAVIETKDGFEPIGGNPALLSLDGDRRAPLAVILSDSWTAEERAAFGVYIVEPMVIPDGKVAVGMPSYERNGWGQVIEVRALEDHREPQHDPNPLDDLRADLEALAQRVATLEGQKDAGGVKVR